MRLISLITCLNLTGVVFGSAAGDSAGSVASKSFKPLIEQLRSGEAQKHELIETLKNILTAVETTKQAIEQTDITAAVGSKKKKSSTSETVKKVQKHLLNQLSAISEKMLLLLDDAINNRSVTARKTLHSCLYQAQNDPDLHPESYDGAEKALRSRARYLALRQQHLEVVKMFAECALDPDHVTELEESKTTFLTRSRKDHRDLTIHEKTYRKQIFDKELSQIQSMHNLDELKLPVLTFDPLSVDDVCKGIMTEEPKQLDAVIRVFSAWSKEICHLSTILSQLEQMKPAIVVDYKVLLEEAKKIKEALISQKSIQQEIIDEWNRTRNAILLEGLNVSFVKEVSVYCMDLGSQIKLLVSVLEKTNERVLEKLRVIKQRAEKVAAKVAAKASAKNASSSRNPSPEEMARQEKYRQEQADQETAVREAQSERDRQQAEADQAAGGEPTEVVKKKKKKKKKAVGDSSSDDGLEDALAADQEQHGEEDAAILASHITEENLTKLASRIPQLVTLLQSPEVETKRCAAEALGYIAYNNQDNLDAIGKTGAIPHLVALLQSDDVETKQSAVGILGNLADNNQENQDAIREVVGAIPHFVALLQSLDFFTKRTAAGTLRNLADNNQANQDAIRDEGGIPKLVALLQSDDVLTKRYAAGALMNLALGGPANQNAIRKVVGAIPQLVALLESDEVETKRCAAGAIYHLTIGNQENQDAIGKAEGAIPQLVALLQSPDFLMKQIAAETLHYLASNNQTNKHVIKDCIKGRPLKFKAMLEKDYFDLYHL